MHSRNVSSIALKGSDHRRATNVTTRLDSQQKKLNLSILPTTTIGSFPQTVELKRVRREFKANKISEDDYVKAIKEEIKKVVDLQEELDIDVLVHGEPERNDMVEFFGEQLSDFAFTVNGWVQSYESRCVKPPIIYGDVSLWIPPYILKCMSLILRLSSLLSASQGRKFIHYSFSSSLDISC